MKKYLLSALALPLLFACSSEDYLDQKATGNDQFAGIAKVDASFFMDEGATTRMDGTTGWTLAEGDKYGFAWLTDAHTATPAYTEQLGIDGKAYQNHPLTQTDGIFKPATSIYVGKYYLYRPYDETTVSPQAIHFNSLMGQPIADGMSSKEEPWKALANTAIIIGDKWTEVTETGKEDEAKKVWEKAGIDQSYNIYAAIFSNQTGLDLTYQNNNVSFAAEQKVAGATDIDYTIAAGTKVGAADIYGATVDLDGAANSFTYAPDDANKEPVKVAGVAEEKHSGTFWADKSNVESAYGFSFTAGAIELKVADKNGVPTEGKTTGWFWFNSLPVTAGNGNAETEVTTTLNTSYGDVTITKALKDCAYVFEKPSTTATNPEWIKVAAEDNAAKKEWNVADHKTFINQYGNHKGKYALTVDFSTGTMNGMHIKNDAYLQKLLKYYIASGKTESDVVLSLDADANGEFKISKLSIALIQTINADGKKVLVQPCSTHGTPKVIVTQDGQAELGLADATEIPSLTWVFKGGIDVYLSSECKWTWSGGEKGKTAVPTDGFIKTIINEGTLTVNATNVQASFADTKFKNAAGATMNITKVTTVKSALTNLGTINVGSASNTSAELRAYGVEIKNDATDLDKCGVINNYGVVGVTEGTTSEGLFNNYGLIEMKNGDAITLLTTNATSDNAFGTGFNAASNKMGTVVLPEGKPDAMVSVSNSAENGFIKYYLNETTYTHNSGNVKYNTIVVSKDITFTGKAAASEVQYIEFNGTRTKVVNPETTTEAKGKLTDLKGIIVNPGKSIIIEKSNIIDCSVGAFLGEGATVYKGGKFVYTSGATTNYFGKWYANQIVKY